MLRRTPLRAGGVEDPPDFGLTGLVFVAFMCIAIEITNRLTAFRMEGSVQQQRLSR